MYWSDGGMYPAIWKAKMDGNTPEIFVSDRLEWPTGLALDLPANRLYWADTKQRIICAIGLDGTGRSTIFTGNVKSGIEHPFSISVFEDYVYGLTWRSRKLFKVNKFGTGNAVIMKRNLKVPASSNLIIAQEQRQVIPKGMLRYIILLIQCNGIDCES